MSDNIRVDFADLRERADFRAALVHYQIDLQGSGDQLRAHCPFHDDARPSFSVNTAKQVFNCHSPNCVAHEGGDIIDFVQLIETQRTAPITLRQAGIRLAEICGLKLDEKATPPRQDGQGRRQKRKRTRSSSPAADATPGAPEAPQTADPVCNEPLKFTLTLDATHPYLTARGLSPALIEAFGLGFYAGERTMVGRVCIPIHNAAGELVAYAGRWVGSDETLPEGEEKYKLPKGFVKTLELFNLHRVKHCRHLVVVEGFFGAIRLHGLRVPSVALMGSHMADTQIALLREHCPALRLVSVMLDHGAGKAAEGIAARLAWHWPVRLLALPEGMQPDTIPEHDLLALLGKG